MLKKLGFGFLWIGLLVYAFGFAPPNQPDTFELIKNLSIGNLKGINPLVVSLFYLMGVWPIIYACLIFFDGRGKIPAWPFAALSFGVGAFALLPYLALRRPNPQFLGSKNLLLEFLDSRWMGLLLAIATVMLLAFGLGYGNWTDFVWQCQRNRFIHVMSLDFCLLCFLFPALLGDDMARRGIKQGWVFWVVALVPLLGPLGYLCWRPAIKSGIEGATDERG